jgi:hypothetical protein
MFAVHLTHSAYLSHAENRHFDQGFTELPRAGSSGKTGAERLDSAVRQMFTLPKE